MELDPHWPNGSVQSRLQRQIDHCLVKLVEDKLLQCIVSHGPVQQHFLSTFPVWLRWVEQELRKISAPRAILSVVERTGYSDGWCEDGRRKKWQPGEESQLKLSLPTWATKAVPGNSQADESLRWAPQGNRPRISAAARGSQENHTWVPLVLSYMGNYPHLRITEGRVLRLECGITLNSIEKSILNLIPVFQVCCLEKNFRTDAE